jgi:hypothetical protein
VASDGWSRLSIAVVYAVGNLPSGCNSWARQWIGQEDSAVIEANASTFKALKKIRSQVVSSALFVGEGQ